MGDVGVVGLVFMGTTVEVVVVIGDGVEDMSTSGVNDKRGSNGDEVEDEDEADNEDTGEEEEKAELGDGDDDDEPGNRVPKSEGVSVLGIWLCHGPEKT